MTHYRSSSYMYRTLTYTWKMELSHNGDAVSGSETHTLANTSGEGTSYSMDLSGTYDASSRRLEVSGQEDTRDKHIWTYVFSVAADAASMTLTEYYIDGIKYSGRTGSLTHE